MKVELILALPEGLEVTNIDVIDGVLTISAVSTQHICLLPTVLISGDAHSWSLHPNDCRPALRRAASAPAGARAQILL